MVESIGFEGIAINAWLVWIVPFIGAALIPALAKKVLDFQIRVLLDLQLSARFLPLLSFQ